MNKPKIYYCPNCRRSINVSEIFGHHQKELEKFLWAALIGGLLLGVAGSVTGFVTWIAYATI